MFLCFHLFDDFLKILTHARRILRKQSLEQLGILQVRAPDCSLGQPTAEFSPQTLVVGNSTESLGSVHPW
jgi:hypothetical protein